MPVLATLGQPPEPPIQQADDLNIVQRHLQSCCCRQVCLVIVRRNCVGMVRQHLVGRATDAAAPTGVGAVVAVMVVSRG